GAAADREVSGAGIEKYRARGAARRLIYRQARGRNAPPFFSSPRDISVYPSPKGSGLRFISTGV
ncbi:hypothetical protein K5M56_03095, partial [Serratia marcescens]|nr:hypothetical protein [Serratia marcescens]